MLYLRAGSARWFGWLLAACVGVGCMGVADRADAVTPSSPEVQAVVKKALGFLGGRSDDRLGGKCLIALCFKKNGANNSHPKVTEALTACATPGFGANALPGVGLYTDNYSLGIALMFLCEVDPEKYHDLIQVYVDELLKRQQPWGSWGYSGMKTGDTSQTQYAVLGMWMAQRVAHIEIPIDRQEAACAWLMRTQDVGGGWGYQGNDPGSLNRTQQSDVSLSLSAAGLGSTYIMANLLEVTKEAEESANGSTSPLKKVASGAAKAGGPKTVTLNPEDIKNTLAVGDRWFAQNYNVQAQTWQHYYMYALERYMSYRERATGVKDDGWYNKGFDYLKRSQTASGAWEGQDNPVIATALAVLFLSRSSQKIIEKVFAGGDGLLKGGMALPKDVRNIAEQNGRVVDEGVSVPAEAIKDLLEGKDNAAIDELAANAEGIKLSDKESERISQVEALRKQVRSEKFETRMVAVASLGKVRSLDNVPQLLYALTDPDVNIVVTADRGLRFISRKVNGVGMPEFQPTSAQIKAAQTAWKNWYLSIRPNAELLD